jgi:hypothetical protein
MVVHNGKALFATADWSALIPPAAVHSDCTLEDLFDFLDEKEPLDYNSFPAEVRATLVHDMMTGSWASSSSWDGTDLRQFGSPLIEQWVAAHPLTLARLSFDLKPLPGKTTELGLPRVRAETRLNSRDLNINTADNDAFDYGALVRSVEANGIHRIVTCRCGQPGCKADTDLEVVPAGDLTRVRVALCHSGEQTAFSIFSRREYAEAVLKVLRLAVSTQQTTAVPGTPGDTPFRSTASALAISRSRRRYCAVTRCIFSPAARNAVTTSGEISSTNSLNSSRRLALKTRFLATVPASNNRNRPTTPPITK